MQIAIFIWGLGGENINGGHLLLLLLPADDLFYGQLKIKYRNTDIDTIQKPYRMPRVVLAEYSDVNIE